MKHCREAKSTSLKIIETDVGHDYLQEHKQTVDPNLVRLAEAYQTAAEKMKEASLLPSVEVQNGDDLPAEPRGEKMVDSEDILASLFGDGTSPYSNVSCQPFLLYLQLPPYFV